MVALSKTHIDVLCGKNNLDYSVVFSIFVGCPDLPQAMDTTLMQILRKLCRASPAVVSQGRSNHQCSALGWSGVGESKFSLKIV